MNNYVEYDIDTLTAGDYTVCFDFAESSYNQFKDNFFDETNPMSENV